MPQYVPAVYRTQCSGCIDLNGRLVPIRVGVIVTQNKKEQDIMDELCSEYSDVHWKLDGDELAAVQDIVDAILDRSFVPENAPVQARTVLGAQSSVDLQATSGRSDSAPASSSDAQATIAAAQATLAAAKTGA